MCVSHFSQINLVFLSFFMGFLVSSILLWMDRSHHHYALLKVEEHFYFSLVYMTQLLFLFGNQTMRSKLPFSLNSKILEEFIFYFFSWFQQLLFFSSKVLVKVDKIYTSYLRLNFVLYCREVPSTSSLHYLDCYLLEMALLAVDLHIFPFYKCKLLSNRQVRKSLRHILMFFFDSEL